MKKTILLTIIVLLSIKPTLLSAQIHTRSNYGDEIQITRWTGVGNGGNHLELSQETIDEILSKKSATESTMFGDPDYPVAYHPKYKPGYGPIDINIVDPLNLVRTNYAIWFENFKTKYIHNVTGNQALLGDSAAKQVFRWVLHDLNSGEMFYSDTTSDFESEQIFWDRGISVRMYQPWIVGPNLVGQYFVDNTYVPVYDILENNNNLITSSVTYADNSYKWLSGIRDDDNVPGSVLNWIRSGTYKEYENPSNNDYNNVSPSSPYVHVVDKPYDPDEKYENIAEGTWAPYILTTKTDKLTNKPGQLYDYNSREDSVFRHLGSIDIVLTSDKDKWTRCPVVEMSMDEELSEGNAKQFALRCAPSVDKDGNPYIFHVDGVELEGEALTEFLKNADMETLSQYTSTDPNASNYISPKGMGWFPGYVIDIETAARLNICFGEDSYYPDLNGRDMLFNPPALKETTILSDPREQLSDPVLFDATDQTSLLGGKHFVYIFPMQDLGEFGTNTMKIHFKSPAYDAGSYMYSTLKQTEDLSGGTLQELFYIVFWKHPLWVGMPMAVEGRKWLPEGNPVKISVRVAKPYQSGYSTIPLELETPELFDEVNHNGYYPYYTFSTIDVNVMEIPTNNTYDIYPNPTTGLVTVKSGNVNYIVIYNSVGQRLRVVQDNAVDMGEFENGVYFFNIVDNAGSSSMQRVIVAR